MIEFLLAAALAAAPDTPSWPTQCEKVGDLYFQAATLRDRGQTTGLVVVDAGDFLSEKAKEVMRHVHQRKDMTAEQWKWFAIGACAVEATQTRVSALGAGTTAYWALLSPPVAMPG